METYKEYKEMLEADKGQETRYKISMNIIKRAIGKNYTEEELEEFIEIEASKNKFDPSEYSEYVKANIK